MKGATHLLMVGSAFPYSEFLPETRNGARRADRYRRQQAEPALSDGSQHGRRQRDDIEGAAAVAEAKDGYLVARKIERVSKPGGRLLEERAMDSADPLNPQRVFWELSPRLPDNAIITADSGSVANWYARDLKLRRGMKASLSGGLASLGAGTPYAVAAKMAYPDRTVIACMGDGAMQMNGLNVMITISKYWKEWSNPRLIVLVLNNRDLNQVPGKSGCSLATARRNPPEHSRFPLSQICRADRSQGHLRATTRTRSAQPGTTRYQAIGRSSWRPIPIPMCRRCRRTSRSRMPRTSCS